MFHFKTYGRMVPLFKGLGHAMVFVCCIRLMYFGVICGWSFFYMFAGFQRELPWADCADGKEWHSPNCYSIKLARSCRQQQYDQNSSLAWTGYNGSCTDMTTYCIQHGFEGGIDHGTTINRANFNCTTTDASVGKYVQLNLLFITTLYLD